MRLTSSDTLRALMKQRGFSMARLGRYSGCSKSFISHLCLGTKKTCTNALAERIAEALEVPLEILFVLDSSRAQIAAQLRALVEEAERLDENNDVRFGYLSARIAGYADQLDERTSRSGVPSPGSGCGAAGGHGVVPPAASSA